MPFCTAWGQFAPRAGEPGTTAIPNDSNILIDWAATCVITAGWIDYQDTSLGKVNWGGPLFATGQADGTTISLGDKGTAILTFNTPIVDGPGFDFVVFENGFNVKDDLDFLELAFVEVSSDGQHFVRFPSACLRDTLKQIGNFDGSKATTVHNLAGKYTARFGTPFDLNELKDSVNLNLNQITHIKIIDVGGSISPAFASRDALGRIINDPYPTPFPQGGFDLDAVGVCYNQQYPTGIAPHADQLSLWPNPARAGIEVHFSQHHLGASWRLFDINGKMITNGNSDTIATANLTSGFYQVVYFDGQKTITAKLVIQP